MDIVAFGCKDLVGNKNAAYFLSKKLDCNYIDCTTETTSPQSIFRIVTKYASEHEDFLPIIGWSNTASLQLRTIYSRKEYTGFHDPNYWNYSANGKNLKLENRRLDRFKDVLFDEHLVNIRWCNIVVSLQEFLKSYKIDYVMYNVENAIDWNANTMHMIKFIDRSKYIGVENPKANIKKYVKKLGYNFATDEGQKCIAGLLKDKLDSK
tara:strand:+ start:960 stop:1583 length:624 start_codon:yes stop_codon:yes gene_type:complete